MPDASIAALAASIHLVLARAEPDALFLWNASPVVAQLVEDNAPEQTARDRIERLALHALAGNLSALDHPASITLRVLYDKTGDRSPVYGEPAFAGVERYAELTLDGPSAAGDRDRWRELSPSGKIPRWIVFTVLGKLPSR